MDALVDSKGALTPDPGQPPSLARQYVDQNELREAFRKLWRRRDLVFATIVVASVLTLLALMQMTPLFTASVSIIIDPRQQHVVDVEAVLEGASKDLEAVYSEAEVLTSPQLIGKLVDKLGLMSVPEFNTALRPPTLIDKYNPIALLPDEIVSVFRHSTAITPEQQLEVNRDKVIHAVLMRLSVAPKARTRVLVIRFESENPQLAAEAANALADLYLTEQLDAKFEATQRVTNWLNDRLAELRKKVDESDRAVEAYRASAGLINTYRASTGIMGGKGVTLIEQQVADLTSQMTVARTERVAAEAKLRQVKDLVAAKNLASGAGGAESVAEVLDSLLIQKLRGQESEILANIADLSQQFGDRHPKLIAARAQLADVRNNIAGEVRKIVVSLENSAMIARSREAAIASQLEDLKKQVIVSNAAEVKLRDLETEASTNRTLMDTFLSRFKETSAQQSGDIQTPDARIIARAELPLKPSFPRIPMFMAVEIFLASCVGIILAFIAEHLDRGFRSGVQFEQETHSPVLAMVPFVREGKGRPADYLVDQPMSSYAEAIRSVYTSLLLTQGSESLKSIVVSSCQPTEGKSVLSLSLTRMIAVSGHRTILVEADLRRPSVHKLVDMPRSAGLAEVLVGSATLQDAIVHDPKTSADILFAGKETLNPSKLLASHQMDELLAELAKTYDTIIIDTAPILAVSDGLLLAHKADGVIYSCRWATTSRETAALGLKELRDAGARVIGAVISMVNVRKSRAYGYADTSYYYYSRHYYHEKK